MIAADGRSPLPGGPVGCAIDAWIVKNDQGDPLHVQGLMIDVTDQALANAEIRRANTSSRSSRSVPGRRRHGRRRERDRLEPGRRAAVRLLRRGGRRPHIDELVLQGLEAKAST